MLLGPSAKGRSAVFVALLFLLGCGRHSPLCPAVDFAMPFLIGCIVNHRPFLLGCGRCSPFLLGHGRRSAPFHSVVVALSARLGSSLDSFCSAVSVARLFLIGCGRRSAFCLAVGITCLAIIQNAFFFFNFILIICISSLKHLALSDRLLSSIGPSARPWTSHCASLALLLGCGHRSAVEVARLFLIGCGRCLALLRTALHYLPHWTRVAQLWTALCALLLGPGRRSAPLCSACERHLALLLVCGHRSAFLPFCSAVDVAWVFTLRPFCSAVDVALRPFCSAVDVALRPFCSAVDVALRPFCSAVDVALRPFCSAVDVALRPFCSAVDVALRPFC
ncbi:uncharacterized protein LOC113634432 [Tachysurus fulvidraco]|uniref:uncharacterized protein LOC113634432 n=1 Tax=Tachysurus fulvidraco TaxID=1234273 RepID=UPI001FEE03F2|nr:uncharacterized protein LOC113634432 [Tachysurus fulvidraco]